LLSIVLEVFRRVSVAELWMPSLPAWRPLFFLRFHQSSEQFVDYTGINRPPRRCNSTSATGHLKFLNQADHLLVCDP